MFSISLKSCEINEFVEEANKFVEEVNDLVRDITSEGCVSLEDAEVLVSEAVRSWEQRLLEMCISKEAGEKVREPIECPECRRVCRPLRLRERDISRRFVASSVLSVGCIVVLLDIPMCRGMLSKSCVDNTRVVWQKRCVAWQCVLTLEKPLRSCRVRG